MASEVENLNKWVIEHAEIIKHDGIHWSGNWDQVPISPDIKENWRNYMGTLVGRRLDYASTCIRSAETRRAHRLASDAVAYWNTRVKQDLTDESQNHRATLEEASGTKLDDIADHIGFANMYFCREKPGSDSSTETSFGVVVVGLLMIQIEQGGELYRVPIMGIATIDWSNPMPEVPEGSLETGGPSDGPIQSDWATSGQNTGGMISNPTGQGSFQAVTALTQGTEPSSEWLAPFSIDDLATINLNGIQWGVGPPSDAGSDQMIQ